MIFLANLYSGPVVGLRAVRILHDLDVAGKKLVAKVDAKNKLLLDNYKEEEEERNKGNEDNSEAHEKKEDADVFETIQQILGDYRAEIDNFEAIQGKQCELLNHLKTELCFKNCIIYNKIFRLFFCRVVHFIAEQKSNKMLQSAVIEEDKRDLINREIGKFRKTAEADEQKKEKEKDRRKRESEKERERDRIRGSPSPRKDKDKKSSSSRRRSRSRERSKVGLNLIICQMVEQ